MLENYRVCVLGDGGVGKSALTVQFVQGIFLERYDPTIEDYYRKLVEYENKQYMLEILDTAGTDQFTSMLDLYMKSGQGFLLVYSIVSAGTFHEIAEMREKILRVKDKAKVPMIVVANKIDLEDHRVISREQGEHLAAQFCCPYIETSAKLRKNVENIFVELIGEMERATSDLPPPQKKKSLPRVSHCSLL